MVYRPQVAGFLTFVLIGGLAFGGIPVSKPKTMALLFLCVMVVTFFFFILPNPIFEFFAHVATVVSSIFLVAQAILLIDVGCTVNDYAMGAARSAMRRNISSAPERNIKLTVIIVSCLMLVASLAGAIGLWVKYSNAWLVVAALVAALLLLLVSIFEWCESGNLFTSCLIVLYTVWLCYEALVAQPSDDSASRPLFFKFLALAVVFACLAAAIFGSGFGLNTAATEAMADQETGDGNADTDVVSPEDRKRALIQSAIHATAALYIATELAPTQDQIGYAFRVIALVLSLVAYAWSLIAPKVLKNRQF